MMVWYEFAFLVSKIFTSSLSFVAVLWCLHMMLRGVCEKGLIRRLSIAIKRNRILASLTLIAFLDFTATTFALFVSPEVTPHILLWFLIIRMIPSNLVSILLMYAAFNFRMLETTTVYLNKDGKD